MTKISIIGLGAIGLPLSLLLSKNNQKVYGYDLDKNRIKKILNPKKEYFDDDIFQILNNKNANKNFIISNKLNKADVYIVCVPTPIKKKNKKFTADLRYLNQAVNAIRKLLKKNDLLIIESTIPVKTCSNIIKKIDNEDILIAHSPERAFPGNTINEMIHNDRIIGSNTNKGLNKAINIYKKFVKSQIIKTDLETAEACKLVENSFRDVNIALSNELNFILSNNNLNVKKIFQLANMHPRVNLHSYGIGVGGHCLPVDPYFLPDFYKSIILKNSRYINDKTTTRCIKKIKKIILDNNKVRIVLLGLTYKEDCNDIRNAPALKIFLSLYKKYENIYACDPLFDMNQNSPYRKKLISLEQIKNNDILIPLVKHKTFDKILFKRNKRVMSIL